jgi:hypothetical protein
MPVDPELQAMLDQVNRYPPVHLQTVAQAREKLERMSTLGSRPAIANLLCQAARC